MTQKQSRKPTRPTWVEISLPQLTDNYRAIRNLVGPECAVLAVVKADAYGHGLIEVAKTLASAGVDWFGVTSADEGMELREEGVTQPILLLTGFWEGEQSALTDFDLTPAVYSEDQLAALEAWGQKAGKRIAFHLKINTGMGRLGIWWQEVDTFVQTYRRMNHVELEGLFAQFSAAEDFTTRQTEEQMERFRAVEEALAKNSIRPRYRHEANSAAIVYRPGTWGNMVRPGLLLYGYQVPPHVAEGAPPLSYSILPVQEVLTFKTKIIAVKEVAAGIALGYGGRYVTPRRSRIATIPVGYADGLNRRLSNRGCGLVGERRVAIVGNISMDLTLLDVTDVPEATVGDEVILIGRRGNCAVTAFDIAEMAGTIPYEVLCGISKRVHRQYLR